MGSTKKKLSRWPPDSNLESVAQFLPWGYSNLVKVIKITHFSRYLFKGVNEKPIQIKLLVLDNSACPYKTYWLKHFLTLQTFFSLLFLIFCSINPWLMCEGYGSRFVCVCLATSFMCWKQGASYGIFKICRVWILLITLCSEVLATFADLCLLCFLTSSWWTKDSNGFFSCTSSDSSNNSSGHSKLSTMLLAFNFLCALNLLIWHARGKILHFI